MTEIESRLMCLDCGATFPLGSMPDEENVCPNCGFGGFKFAGVEL